MRHVLARTTIAGILTRHGIDPAPERNRKTTWKEFLTRHWNQIVATDFFTVEVWTCSGLPRFVILFFMDVSTRRVEIGGIASLGNGLWMAQIARNLTDAVDGLFTGKRYLIHDRDPLYTREFLITLGAVGIRICEIAAAIAEFECLCGAVRPHNQRELPRADDLLWRRRIAECDPRVRNALSSRAESPRTR